jgi:lysyl-tRNA synthetase class 1
MSNTKRPKSVHWADITADNIIRTKGEKSQYTCASGVTPSGTVHIGNFREIISVELVARALRDKGRHVRFIFSWDEYDVFRKVPKNMPKPELLETFLRKPITLVPDTTGKYENYARANERVLEQQLPKVGVEPEYIYQAERYRSSEYARGIRTALEHKDELRKMLNEHRTTPLPDDWWPVSVFSNFTDKDTTTVLDWNGEWELTYRCEETGNVETVDLRKTSAVKLPWRIDWPMRWALEEVDFEPAGKDHHSEGGSFDTSKSVVKVFGGEPPVTFQYDFIRIKGRGGKISSSSGEVVDLGDVLEIYPPEIIRYLFVGTRPNSEFAISFDLDVLKIFEDYDKCERIYFSKQAISEKKKAKELRIYELSQVHEIPEQMPYQVPLRHLCNMLQSNEGDIEATISSLPDVEDHQVERLRVRCACAWNWLKGYAPEDFKFSLNHADQVTVDLTEEQKAAVASLAEEVEKIDSHTEKSMAEAVYAAAHDNGVEPTELFRISYQIIVGKDKGPRLAGFIMLCGKDKILPLLYAALGR